MPKPEFLPFATLPKPALWCVLFILSFALAALLRLIQLPAALLLGPMIAAILIETGGGKILIPRVPYAFAMAVIGCMIARSFTADMFVNLMHQWPVCAAAVTAVIIASSLLGFVLSHYKILPDTTAIWGLLPGAASVMMVMAESFGADIRLVAFMQYLRVAMVAAAASLVARFWVHATASGRSMVWFPQIHWLAFGETLLLIVVGMVAGKRLRFIPAGPLLVPMFIGAALQITGVLQLELPQWLLVSSYALLGWSIGLRFTRAILLHALRLLPQIMLSILALMAFCAALAALLVYTLGIDPLTAYLATSPGGADSAAIIAASTKVDMPFVMALQLMRLIIILLIGPPVARWTARKVKTGA